MRSRRSPLRRTRPRDIPRGKVPLQTTWSPRRAQAPRREADRAAILRESQVPNSRSSKGTIKAISDSPQTKADSKPSGRTGEAKREKPRRPRRLTRSSELSPTISRLHKPQTPKSESDRGCSKRRELWI